RDPFLAVIASFDDDFGPVCGHYGKQTIIIHAPKWRRAIIKRDRPPRPRNRHSKHTDHQHRTDQEDNYRESRGCNSRGPAENPVQKPAHTGKLGSPSPLDWERREGVRL